MTAAAEDYSALQSTALANVAGEELPILRYRFENFPRTLELTLVFRTAEQPDDVQTIALPWPGSGEASFDLSRIEAWRGTIVELGFAQFATAQLVAPERGFAPFTLVSVGLESDSWAGRIRALLTGWSLLTPWQLISVSAVGPSEVGDSSPHAPRLPLVLALALGLAAVWARLVLGWSGRRLGGGLLVVAALAWVVADAAWLRSLAYKRSVDRDVWGDVPLAQRQDHVVDAELRDAATHLKQMLVNAPPTTRILVDADSPHDVLRLTYLASPSTSAPTANSRSPAAASRCRSERSWSATARASVCGRSATACASASRACASGRCWKPTDWPSTASKECRRERPVRMDRLVRAAAGRQRAVGRLRRLAAARARPRRRTSPAAGSSERWCAACWCACWPHPSFRSLPRASARAPC